MELLSNLALGFATAASPENLFFCLDRRAARHADRRAAGHRRHGDHRHAAADHLPARAGLLAHHAGRHLLRRAVWRLDHGHPDQHAGRILVRRHRHRRLPDGAQGQGRNGARRRGARLLLRRHGRDPAGRDLRAAADRHRAEVRRGRIFLADGARPRLGRSRSRTARSSRRWPWWCSACCSASSAPTSTAARRASPSASPNMPTG